MALVTPSTKEQIVVTAERLFAAHGIDGISLRQIGTASGNGNHSAVQYHFGSKERLVWAIIEYRLPGLEERRRHLMAQHPPFDLRSRVECYVLPILEQGEQAGSHFLSFIAVLQQSAERYLFDRLPEELGSTYDQFREDVSTMLSDIPEPLRSHRIAQASTFAVHASADRERAQAAGIAVLPFSVHVADLLDGLVGFLRAPVSSAARAAIGRGEPPASVVALPV